MLSCAGLNSWRWLIVLGLGAAPFTACGPDHRPEPCDGPSFKLVVRAENGPLPPDTHINVRYGGNADGEPYELGTKRTPQAVSCVEDTSPGGAPAEEASAGAGEAGARSDEDLEVWRLRCGLYTQGPARLDATAAGYEPIKDAELSFNGNERKCEVEKTFALVPLKPDAGK
jgi:hypothetical protein